MSQGPQGDEKASAACAPFPAKLLAHLRRWKRHGERFCAEWNRQPVKDCDKAFRANAQACGIEATPHTLRHAGCHLVDASWGRFLAGCRISRHVAQDVAGPLRPPPPGLPIAGRVTCLIVRHNPSLNAENGTGTNANERRQNCKRAAELAAASCRAKPFAQGRSQAGCARSQACVATRLAAAIPAAE